MITLQLLQTREAKHPNLGDCIVIKVDDNDQAIIKLKQYNTDLFYEVDFHDLSFN